MQQLTTRKNKQGDLIRECEGREKEGGGGANAQVKGLLQQ